MCRLAIYALLLYLCSSLGAQDSLLITDPALDEVSGIVCGKQNPDLYYVINDSGGKPEVYGLNQAGQTAAIFKLNRITNRDWEDIAMGPGPIPGKDYIYVGEIGDNAAQYAEIALYRFAEPAMSSGDRRLNTCETKSIDAVQKLRIQFADGAKDCESLFLDPHNGDVYLVSKREQTVGLYQIKAPLDTLNINIARRVTSLSFPLAVAADISPGRDKILVKTYSDIYCWQLTPAADISTALSQPQVTLPYRVEPQGESICFSADGKSYLTISEASPDVPLQLYIYPIAK